MSTFEKKKPKWPRNLPSYEQEKNGYQNVNLTSFFLICGSELLNLLILCDLGAETSISGVYCLSSDL